MIVLDTNLLSDVLTGEEAAEVLLTELEDEQWAISSISLYETMMGAVYGNLGDVAPELVYDRITGALDVLDITPSTVAEAVALQVDLMDRGVPADLADALIAATARANSAAFVTADEHFWQDEVLEVLTVIPYERD